MRATNKNIEAIGRDILASGRCGVEIRCEDGTVIRVMVDDPARAKRKAERRSAGAKRAAATRAQRRQRRIEVG